MGWDGEKVTGRVTARRAVELALGKEAADGAVIRGGAGVAYAAVPCQDGMIGGVVYYRREGEYVYTKAIDEGAGPFERFCPREVLDALTEPAPNEWAAEWRLECSANLGVVA